MAGCPVGYGVRFPRWLFLIAGGVVALWAAGLAIRAHVAADVRRDLAYAAAKDSTRQAKHVADSLAPIAASRRDTVRQVVTHWRERAPQTAVAVAHADSALAVAARDSSPVATVDTTQLRGVVIRIREDSVGLEACSRAEQDCAAQHAADSTLAAKLQRQIDLAPKPPGRWQRLAGALKWTGVGVAIKVIADVLR